MIVNKRRFKFILLMVTVILLTPLIAMQFTDSVNWTLLDFIVAGGLLLGIGILSDFVIRNTKNSNYRIIIIAIILIIFLLIWAEIAVGIFDIPFEGN